MTIFHHKSKGLLGFFSVLIVVFFFGAHAAFAADAALYLSPVTGTYTTGTNFTLSIVVGSGGQAVNAIEGKLEYDPKELEVVSTDIGGSVLTSWTVSPNFSNDTGELSFAGLLSTSTVLDRGEVLKFTVKSLRTGELHIRFATGAAVHAADGTGGNILSQLSGGVYVTIPAQTDPAAPTDSSVSAPTSDTSTSSGETGTGEVLGAATGTEITSSTHPDENTWYATSTAVLDWGIPAGTQSILLGFDRHKGGEGTNPYPPTIHEKVIKDNKDGIWYFHLTRIAADGSRHTDSYRVAIDTAAPSQVQVSEVTRKDASDPNVSIQVTASDTLSGIDHYEFDLDQNQPSTWVDDGTHVRTYSGVVVGTHELTVFAIDKAGNRAAGRVEFTVENLPSPSLTLLNKTFIEGGKLQLALQSVPNSTLDIHIARADASPVTEEFTVDAKGAGVFTSALELAPGSYTVSAVAHSGNGALSKESNQALFDVNSSFIGVMKRHPMIPVAIIALILLIASSYYYWKYISRGDSSDDDEEDTYADESEEDDDEHQPIIQAPTVKQPTKTRAFAQGAVVLGEKKKPQLPATRL